MSGEDQKSFKNRFCASADSSMIKAIWTFLAIRRYINDNEPRWLSVPTIPTIKGQLWLRGLWSKGCQFDSVRWQFMTGVPLSQGTSSLTAPRAWARAAFIKSLVSKGIYWTACLKVDCCLVMVTASSSYTQAAALVGCSRSSAVHERTSGRPETGSKPQIQLTSYCWLNGC